MWSVYMGHVAALDRRRAASTSRRRAAGRGVRAGAEGAAEGARWPFLAEHAIRTPEWLAPADITSRTGSTPMADAQAAGVLNTQLSTCAGWTAWRWASG